MNYKIGIIVNEVFYRLLISFSLMFLLCSYVVPNGCAVCVSHSMSLYINASSFTYPLILLQVFELLSSVQP
jgi:hypothetical protein